MGVGVVCLSELKEALVAFISGFYQASMKAIGMLGPQRGGKGAQAVRIGHFFGLRMRTLTKLASKIFTVTPKFPKSCLELFANEADSEI